jgi:hypothetical protein
MHKIRNFHEGHNTVAEWQGSGRRTTWERYGMCESAFNTAGERHGMCESTFNRPHIRLVKRPERHISISPPSNVTITVP